MQSACKQSVCMARTLQVRAVPEKVHRRLKARAADAGLSISAYLLAELTRFAALPTREEMRERRPALATASRSTAAYPIG